MDERSSSTAPGGAGVGSMIPGLIPGLLLVLSSHAVGTGDGHDYHASARDGSWRGGPRSSDCPSPIHFSPQRQFRYADVAEPPQRRFLFGREDWTAAMSGSEEGDRTGTCMLRDRSGLSRPAAQLALRGGGSESSEEGAASRPIPSAHRHRCCPCPNFALTPHAV